MYQLFEIILRRKEINLEKNLTNIKRLGWYSDGYALVREDDSLQYSLDLSAFTLKCTMSELFPLSEGEWSSADFPSREELVNSAVAQLNELPFELEITEIRRTVKHE
jgi:hypothetical protein